MNKLYLGVDLHKQSCWVTVLDADGHVRESRKLGTEKWELLEFFGMVEKPAAVAVEATFNRYYFLNVIEPLGLELHLAGIYMMCTGTVKRLCCPVWNFLNGNSVYRSFPLRHSKSNPLFEGFHSPVSLEDNHGAGVHTWEGKLQGHASPFYCLECRSVRIGRNQDGRSSHESPVFLGQVQPHPHLRGGRWSIIEYVNCKLLIPFERGNVGQDVVCPDINLRSPGYKGLNLGKNFFLRLGSRGQVPQNRGGRDLPVQFGAIGF